MMCRMDDPLSPMTSSLMTTVRSVIDAERNTQEQRRGSAHGPVGERRSMLAPTRGQTRSLQAPACPSLLQGRPCTSLRPRSPWLSSAPRLSFHPGPCLSPTEMTRRVTLGSIPWTQTQLRYAHKALPGPAPQRSRPRRLGRLSRRQRKDWDLRSRKIRTSGLGIS